MTRVMTIIRKVLTYAVVKLADPNRSGGDDKLTLAAPSSTFVSDPPVPFKSRKGTTGIPAQALKIAKNCKIKFLAETKQMHREMIGCTSTG